jgi:hypothetical protein
MLQISSQITPKVSPKISSSLSTGKQRRRNDLQINESFFFLSLEGKFRRPVKGGP